MLARCSTRVLTKSAFATVRTVVISSSGHRYHARNRLVAGLVGYFIGVTSVGVAGYGIYYFSGVKDVVDTLTPTLALLKETSKALINDEPAPNVALQYLRKAAKAYLAHIPGSAIVVDSTFNRLDGIVDRHGGQATQYLKQAYSDFLRIVQHGGNKHESHTALEVLAVCKRLAEDIGALGIDSIELPKGTQAVNFITEKAARLLEPQKDLLKVSGDQVWKVVSQVKDTMRSKTPTPPRAKEDTETPSKKE